VAWAFSLRSGHFRDQRGGMQYSSVSEQRKRRLIMKLVYSSSAPKSGRISVSRKKTPLSPPPLTQVNLSN
jgi:hypothetical protein